MDVGARLRDKGTPLKSLVPTPQGGKCHGLPGGKAVNASKLSTFGKRSGVLKQSHVPYPYITAWNPFNGSYWNPPN